MNICENLNIGRSISIIEDDITVVFDSKNCTFVIEGSSSSKNEITVANAGSKPWHGIEVSAGGHVFVIETLEVGAFKTFDFDSMHEGAGFIAISREGEKQEQAFGYYTPNLSSEVALILGDRTNGIEVVEMESTVQTIENLVAEKSKERYAARRHLQVLGKELASENP